MTKVLLAIRVIFILCISTFAVNKYLDQVSIKYEINILEPSSRVMGQLYYKSTDHFGESKVKLIHYDDTRGEFQRKIITMNHRFNIISLRLDPLLDKGLVEIKNFTVNTAFNSFPLDFRNVSTKSESNNIEIIEKNKNAITLSCDGTDPSFVIVRDLNLEKSKWSNLPIIIVLSIMLYIFLRVLSERLLLLSILVIYTAYALLFSTWDMAYNLILIFMFISMYIGIKDISLKVNYLKEILFVLLVYMGISYSGMLLETPLFNINYLHEKSLLILAVFMIPFAFYNMKMFDYEKFKIVLTTILILFALVIILFNFQLVTIDNIIVWDVVFRRDQWTQKNYTFWYLLLMFSTLSFYTLRSKKDIFIILFIVAISYYAIFNAYSYSARVAFVIGILVYTILLFVKVKKYHLLIFIWLLTAYIIFAPIILGLIDLSEYHPRLVARDAIFHAASVLIREHWLFGYGFGSTLSVNIHDFVKTENLPIHYYDTFPGGHPHNLSLLFWLEFGIFGALFLAYFLHRFFLLFVEATYNKINQPALFGMIISFEVITSFSWSIWYPQVLLTFSFFGVMLALSMNIKIKRA